MRATFTDPFRRQVAQAAFYGGNTKQTAAEHGLSINLVNYWRRRYYGKINGYQWGVISRLLRDHGPMGAAAMHPHYVYVTGSPVTSSRLSNRIRDEYVRGKLDRSKVGGRWVYAIKQP